MREDVHFLAAVLPALLPLQSDRPQPGTAPLLCGLLWLGSVGADGPEHHDQREPDRPVEGVKGDIYIPAASARRAMHGDRVLIKIARIESDGRQDAVAGFVG